MSRNAWAETIGAELKEDGTPTLATLVSHIRAASVIESYLLRSRVVRAFKESYAPFAGDEVALRDAVHEALEVLVRVGDLSEFTSDGGPGYVATPERLVSLDEDYVAILGMSQITIAPSEGLVRRRHLSEVLALTNAPCISLAEEIGLAGWRAHLVAAGGLDNNLAGPSALFFHLASLAVGGDRLERQDSDSLRILVGRGDYFGQVRAAKPEGRWSPLTVDGVYCAARRRQYGWQNCIVSSTAQGVNVVDILDADCWRWAVVGQTLAAGDPIIRWTKGLLQCLTPPPFQIQRLLALAGQDEGPWRSRISESTAQLVLRLVGQAHY